MSEEVKLRLVIPKAALAKKEDSSPKKEHSHRHLITGFNSTALPINLGTAPQPLYAVPLSRIITKTTQNAFRQLENLEELFRRMTDGERKVSLLEYLIQQRMLFAKLCALLEWKDRLSDLLVVHSKVDTLLDEKAMPLTELADRLCLAHYEYGKIACPLYSVDNAMEICSQGLSWSGLPLIFKDFMPLSEFDKTQYVERLNRLIVCRLAYVQIPDVCKVKGINDGAVTVFFNNFKVVLRLVPGPDNSPQWFLSKAHPLNATASGKIKESVLAILQSKYNNKALDLFSLAKDISLYETLFTLHQLYCQFTELKKSCNLRLEHSEGYLRVSLYHGVLNDAKLLFTVNSDSGFSACCSWDPSLVFSPSFDCFDFAEKVRRSAHIFLATCILSRYKEELCDCAQFTDTRELLFTFHSFTSLLTIDAKSGQLKVYINGQKQSSIQGSSSLCKDLKKLAAEMYLDSIENEDVVYCFSSAEKTKLGSHPKLMLRVADQLYLSLGIDLDTLQPKCFLVYSSSDSLLKTINYNQCLPNSQSLQVPPDVKSLFYFECKMKEHNLVYTLNEQVARVHSLNHHLSVEKIEVTVDTAMIFLHPEYLPIKESIITLTHSTFDELMTHVKLYLKALLLLQQVPEASGTLNPLNVMLGDHWICIREGQLILDGHLLTNLNSKCLLY